VSLGYECTKQVSSDLATHVVLARAKPTDA